MTKPTHCNEPMTAEEKAFTRAAGHQAVVGIDYLLGQASAEDVEAANAEYLVAHDALLISRA